MSAAPILFDATRLVARGNRITATGIDRVALAYARWLLSRSDVELTPVLAWGDQLRQISLKSFRGLLASDEKRSAAAYPAHERSWAALQSALMRDPPADRALRAGGPPRPLLADAGGYADLARRLVARRPFAPKPGSLYLNVSHFGLEDPRLLPRLARRGVETVVLLHDLIPTTHPEYCAPGAGGLHTRRVRGVLASPTKVITNSQTTADDVAQYALSQGFPVPSLAPVPLGLEPAFLTQTVPAPAARSYFVCVGTIEARKNLAFLLAVWRRLWEQLGEATPYLVIVGRRGWENESVMDQLERSPAAIRFVHEAANLDDTAVACLIAGATALLAPSSIEGFDLPVMEALALGTPVVASDIPAHRELAGGARLVDPLDGPSWLAAVLAARARAHLAPIVVSPTWEGHFAAVAELLGLEPRKALQAAPPADFGPARTAQAASI